MIFNIDRVGFMYILIHEDVGDLLISSAFQKLLLKISNFVTNIMYANNAQLENAIVQLCVDKNA